jgi:hypothetical protein
LLEESNRNLNLGEAQVLKKEVPKDREEGKKERREEKGKRGRKKKKERRKEKGKRKRKKKE